MQSFTDALAGAGGPWLAPLLFHFAMALAALWPLVRLLGRVGLPRLWAAAMFVPLIGPALVGSLLAFADWPTVPPLRGRKRRS